MPTHIIHASPLPSLPIPLPDTQLCQYILFIPPHCLPSPSLYLILNYANTHYSCLSTAFPPHPSTWYSTMPIHIIHASPLPSLHIPLPDIQLCQYTLFMPLHCLPSTSLYLILNYANTHYSCLPTAFPPHPSTWYSTCQYTLFMPLHCLPSTSLYLILNYANTRYSCLSTAFPPHPST